MIGQGTLKPSYTQRPAFFAGILGILASLAGTLLVMGYVGTADTIALREKEDLQQSLAEVLPEGFDNDPATDRLILERAEEAPLTLYIARQQGEPMALAFEVAEEGYSGSIRLVMGVSRDGELSGVRVLSHTETPGLGDKIEIAKADWITHFNGLSLDNTPGRDWAVKKDGGRFDQFSGATITPRAVVKAVFKGLLLHDQQLRLLDIRLPAVSESTEESKP